MLTLRRKASIAALLGLSLAVGCRTAHEQGQPRPLPPPAPEQEPLPHFDRPARWLMKVVDAKQEDVKRVP